MNNPDSINEILQRTRSLQRRAVELKQQYTEDKLKHEINLMRIKVMELEKIIQKE